MGDTMIREMPVNGAWINIPVWMDGKPQRMEIFLKTGQKTEKVFEAFISVGEGICDFHTPISTSELVKSAGETVDALVRISIETESAVLEQLFLSDEPEKSKDEFTRPAIHFTARTGWSNDPNGLIYDDGIYHLYFQYNPFGLDWGNMSWGHAESRDLLHWTQKDTVMFPDGDGCIYSGCAIKNDRKSLNLPKSALIFFYTAAGDRSVWSKNRNFVQKIAYSIDGGETLTKLPVPCVPEIYADSRDPKVYWHEESDAYVMVLWLRENEFGILRSHDLLTWQITDSFSLEGGWECPDLLKLKDEDGNSHYFFWTAEGYYYPGEFDGWHFRQTGERKCAYLTKLPYAAQTYSEVTDRVISIPWLRVPNDGRPWTGTYGIPVELSCKNGPEGPELIQKPVKELKEAARDITDEFTENRCYRNNGNKTVPLLISILAAQEPVSFEVNESLIEYDAAGGTFSVDEEICHIKPGNREADLLVDDNILEVFFDTECRTGAFKLKNRAVSLKLSPESIQDFRVYEIEQD